MTEMLERVARAIAEARGYDWEFVAELHATGPDRAEFRMQAQAVLEEMWEPTAAMLDALGPEGIRADADIVRGVFTDIWRVMIRVALGESP